MTNPRCFLVLGFLALAARVHGQTDLPSLDGALVRCGTEQVVIIDGSESKDGRLAAGWTIRPKEGKPPAVDWSAYRRDAPLSFVKRYGLNDNPSEDGDDPSKSLYRLVNGVVDVRARTFTALAFESPYLPDKYRSGLEAAWMPGSCALPRRKAPSWAPSPPRSPGHKLARHHSRAAPRRRPSTGAGRVASADRSGCVHPPMFSDVFLR